MDIEDQFEREHLFLTERKRIYYQIFTELEELEHLPQRIHMNVKNVQRNEFLRLER